MESLVKTLRELRSRTKISEKTQILQNIKDPETKRVLSFLADDNQIIGISTRKLNKNVPLIEHSMGIVELIEHLLGNNSGKDHEIGMVKHFLSLYDSETQDVLSQVIGKSWTTTVGATLLNKVYGDGFVPVFDVQLAFPYEKKIDKFPYETRFVVTQKLDGFRALVCIQDGRVQWIKSRKGKNLSGLSELTQHLEQFLPKDTCMVYDGELLLLKEDGTKNSNELFRETSKTIMSDGESTGVSFNIFDALPQEEFFRGFSTLEYQERRRTYLDVIKEGYLVKVVPVLGEATKEEISFWSDYAAQHGFEGVMLNDPGARYETKRTAGLLKVKKMHTADLPIIGFEQAIDGKNRGGLKSIVLQLDEDNLLNVSSGLTESQRNEIWENQDTYIGKIAEIQYFEETEDKNGNKSLRFPVILGIRDDKTVNDVNID